jgi:hypothetical protein
MKGAKLAAIAIGLMAGANLSQSGSGWSNPYKTAAKRGKSASAKKKQKSRRTAQQKARRMK